jgi:hypothetical protein
LFESLFVAHTEALLFVDHQQAQVAKFHVFREQPVRTDHDIDLAFRDFLQRLLDVLGAAESREHFDAHGERREARTKRLVVLECEHGGGAPAAPLASRRPAP